MREEGWKKGLLAAGWNVYKAVELAIEVEEMGRSVYGAFAWRWDSDAALRNLFRRLSREELAHQEGLEALLDEVDATRSDTQLDLESLQSIARAAFFSSEGGALGLLEQLSSPESVLEAVLRFERGTTLYYRGLRDVLGPSYTLDLLIAEELRHADEVARELRALRPEPGQTADRVA
jgi:rubrerythrin